MSAFVVGRSGRRCLRCWAISTRGCARRSPMSVLVSGTTATRTIFRSLLCGGLLQLDPSSSGLAAASRKHRRLAPAAARNNLRMAEAVVTVAEVKAFKTQSGNTRFVLRDDEGREYTTFREQIARDALAAEGRRARITFHEQQRGNFTNVYLDAVEPLEEASDGGPSEAVAGGAGAPPEAVEEVAWKTAVDAAPWLLGGEPEEAVPPEELFERLQPFKERVADDIRGEPSDDADD